MVVLPLLDSCLYLGRLWFLLRQRHSPVADFRTLCHHHAVHLWRQLPTIIINKTGLNPYAARMRAMFIFALFPLLALFAQPLGEYSYWFPIIIIGIAGAAHQSWSANIYSVGSDMFPNSAVATIIGLGGMAGVSALTSSTRVRVCCSPTPQVQPS